MLSKAHPQNITWQQTMLRIKDPKVSVPFYENHFGFKLLHSMHFEEWKFSLYFMIIPREGAVLPEPGTPESEQYMLSMKDVCLELTHNHGSETDDTFQVNNGNVEPFRGFGHIAVMTRDVYAASEELEANGVRMQKRPNEGRMKGLAFALDPDGYWIEVVSRDAASAVGNKYTFAQTMIRIKDPSKSIPFYRDQLGMTLLRESHFPDAKFSLYFFASLPAGVEVPDPTQPSEFIRNMFEPVLELTHNHGTELDPLFSYHNGNDQDQGQLRGFGHTGFLVDDLEATCAELESQGVQFKKKPSDGLMRNLAFVYDPDNYWVELIQKR